MTADRLLGPGEASRLSHHVLLSETHRLVLFSIPKVGCTQLIQLMRRMNGADDWLANPHYAEDRQFLSERSPERIDAILRSADWTRATVLRDPAERLLSAYLDKFVGRWSYASDVFGFPGLGMPFEQFLELVLDANDDPAKPTGLHHRTDPHWRPQRLVGSLGAAERTLDVVGDFETIASWIEDVLRRVDAWDGYGSNGWGEDGRRAIFETNTAPHQTQASRRMGEFYRSETLRAVYDAYRGDIDFAARFGIDLVRHRSLLD